MAEGIIIELQRDALDENISLEMLLQKAYLVARKLKLDEFEKWLSQEQEGYGDSDSIPAYRRITGETKAWNPMRGWIPIITDSPQFTDAISQMPLTISIPAIVDCYKSNESYVAFGLGSEITDALNKMGGGFPTKFDFFVSKSELYGIMSTVRKKILDWSLILEENGIMGEGMTFSEVEKTAAKSNPIINNYTNNFFAEVKDVDLVQGKCS